MGSSQCPLLPLQDMCIVPRARKVVLCLSLFGIVAYSFGAWTSGVQEIAPGRAACSPLARFRHVITISNNIDTFITLIIPSCSIFIMNIRIILKIAYFYDKRSELTVTFSRSTGGGDGRQGARDAAGNAHAQAQQQLQRAEVSLDETGSVTTHVKPPSSPRHRSQMKITKLLLVVSTMFLLLNLPSHAIRVYSYFRGIFDSHYAPSRSLLLWQQFFTIIYNCNFSINFFLYSLCGKNFRKALCQMIRSAYHKICLLCCCHRYTPGFAAKDYGIRREATTVTHSFLLRVGSSVSKL